MKKGQSQSDLIDKNSYLSTEGGGKPDEDDSVMVMDPVREEDASIIHVFAKWNDKNEVKTVAKKTLKVRKKDNRTSRQPRLSNFVQAITSEFRYAEISNRPLSSGNASSKLRRASQVQ
ncbi:hypothetical protein V6N11_010395 [Hibiscus sabdariffa]|uniref:Uncharacterized protein n=1 Tax=Hibiscus sabdariffa TaxID=183260 RepID=A0ABR2S570_9ROSI